MPYKDVEKRREKCRIYNQEHKEEIKITYQEYYQKNKVKIKKQSIEWQLKNKKKRNTIRRKYYQRNKEKSYVQLKARRNTKLESNCLFCNITENLERHHPDYSEPLRINTLCRDCHKNLHTYIKII